MHGKLYRLGCETSGGKSNATLANSSISEADLWHQRLGHVGDQLLKKIVNEDLLTGVKVPKFQTPSFCEGCAKEKMTRRAPKSVGEIRSTKKLQLIHSDVSGPMQTETTGSKRYVITFTDTTPDVWQSTSCDRSMKHWRN